MPVIVCEEKPSIAEVTAKVCGERFALHLTNGMQGTSLTNQNSQVMFYNVGILYCEQEHGIYTHLPFESPVTTDKKEALKLFEYELHEYTKSWRSNELIYDKTKEKDTFPSIRQALVRCNEAGHLHGYFILELNEWNYNPQD